MKYINKKIDEEYFKNDWFIDELETDDEIERYKNDMRGTYDYAFYTWNMTISPYKVMIKDFIVDTAYKIVNGFNKVLEFILQRIEK